MLVRVVPSIHRPWNKQGGYYSCEFFRDRVFTELSARVTVKQIRDGLGRWRKVRGVKEFLSEADFCDATAFRCRDSETGAEGYLVVGGSLGVLIAGVGDPGIGAPIVWVDNVKDFAPAAQKVLQESIKPVDDVPVRPLLGPAPSRAGLISLDSIRPPKS